MEPLRPRDIPEIEPTPAAPGDGSAGAVPADRARPADEASGVEVTVGTTVRAMFRRDSLYMVASSLQLLSGVLVTPFMTRVLGLHQYGVFAADLALLYVLYYTSNLGLNIGIQRLYSQADGERRSRNLLAASLVLVSTVTAVIYVSGPRWSPVLGFGAFPLSTRLTVVWSGLFAMTWICLAVLRCHERLGVFTVVCLLQAIVGIGIGTLVAYLHQHLATDVLWCALVTQAVAVLVALSTVTPRWRGLWDVRTVGATLRFSLPIVPLHLSTFVLSASDRFIILRDLGPGATGRYQVAYTLGAVGISLLTFLNLAWLPRIFAIRDRRTRAAVLAASRDDLYRLLVPVTVGLALAGPILLRIWAPRSFRVEQLLPVIVLVVAATIPVCTAFVHSRVLLSEGRSAVVALATVVAAGLNVALNLALVPHLGINGSALATTVSYTVLATAMAALSRLLLPLARPSVRLIGSLLVAEAVVLLSSRIPVHGPWLAVRGAGVAVAAVAAYATFRDLQAP